MGKTVVGFDGKEYNHKYSVSESAGWLATESAMFRVISILNGVVFTRMRSPVTGEDALLYLSGDPSQFGIVSVYKDGNYIHVPLIDFINGDYKLPEKGEL